MKPGIGIFALVLLIFSGCGWDETAVENFDYDLRGTWVSIREPDWWETEEKGRLEIGYDTIKITGSVRPFNTGYTKGFNLQGYSEESSSDGGGISYEKKGTLFIKDAGSVKSVPYLIWRTGTYGAYVDMLTINPSGTDLNKETFTSAVD
ncbi:hypothetical protein AGMMS49940_17340 [Spirochaetia bacterium]|nr:hypothetical protein AGMMS49940_17340 [Spirochaetia bacterium]